MTIYPDVDGDSAPFWAALRDHRLVIQRCRQCAKPRFPSRPICAACYSTSFEWVESSGLGRLVTWTVTRQVLHPAFVNVPYAVLLVELEEYPGVILFGNLSGDVESLRPALELQAIFEDVAADLTLLQWEVR